MGIIIVYNVKNVLRDYFWYNLKNINSVEIKCLYQLTKLLNFYKSWIKTLILFKGLIYKKNNN